MLTIKKVSKTFNAGTVNEKKALDQLSLTLDDGDFVTVIGGNGAGKSTLLNMIAGVYPIDCGHIVLDGKDISLDPEYKRARWIGRVFQDPLMGTAADMEIAENLALAKRRGKARTLRWGCTKRGKGRVSKRFETSGSWTGRSDVQQGGAAFGRAETGADAFDGESAKAETAFA